VSVQTTKLLNVLQQKYLVFFIDSSVDATKNPPVVNAFVRLPINKPQTTKLIRFEVVPLRIKIDKMLRRVIRSLEKVYRRWKAGHVRDVTIDLLLAGVYAPNYAVYKHRNKINRALRQLPRDNKVRKYIQWRLTKEREKRRRKLH